MQVTVKLHGFLKEVCSDLERVYEVKTIAEAVKAWSLQNKKNFKEIPTVEIVESPDVDSLYVPLTDNKVINILPSFEGSGGGGGGSFIKIAIGAVLVATGGWIGTTAWAAAGGFGASLSTALIGTGIAFALGGVIEMLSPTPKLNMNTDFTSDQDRSKYLGAPKNTTKIGTPIPVGYGRFKIGGQILSYNIDAKTVSP